MYVNGGLEMKGKREREGEVKGKEDDDRGILSVVEL